MPMTSTTAPIAKGFTLFEVLIALLILSIGLLSLAGMLSTGLHSDGGAYIHTQATLLAADMAGRMRANEAGVAAGDYKSFDGTVTGSPPNCVTTGPTGCSPSGMAEDDLSQWAAELANRLPGGKGTITQESDGVTYKIDVQWNSVDNSGKPRIDHFVTSVRP